MSRPHILLFHSHDTGRWVGPYGVTTVDTPTLNRIAAEGMTFERVYCSAPQCSPSRSSLFTGRYPHSNGVIGLTHTLRCDLHAGELHAAQHFRMLGYETAGIGIRHEASRRQENLGYDFSAGESRASQVGGEFGRFLDQRDPGRPFFASVGTGETHRKYLTDGVRPDEHYGVMVPPWLENGPHTRRDFAEFQGSARRWDDGLRDLLAELEERDLLDETLVVVTTDHGLAVPRAKCTLYEAGVGILFLMRYPKAIPAGARTSALISNVDVLPTLLDAVEAPADLPGRELIQGESFWPVARGETDVARETVFFEHTYQFYYDPARGLRTDRWRYLRNFHIGPGVHVPGDVSGTPMYLENQKAWTTPARHPLEELYDMRADPTEQTNLAGEPEHAETLGELRDRLHAWMRETRDPLLDGPIPSPYFENALHFESPSAPAAGKR